MIVVGIDPGLGGALVALDGDRNIHLQADTPTIEIRGGKRQYCERQMLGLLIEAKGLAAPGEDISVVIESQQARPKQGLSSTFRTGYGYGLWRGLIVSLGFSYAAVTPRAWTQVMLAGAPGEGKKRSLLAAQQMFPDIELVKPGGRVPSLDGRADAALLAAYGLRQLKGGAL